MTMTAVAGKHGAEGAEAPAKSRKKPIFAVLALVLLAAGGWYMFLRPTNTMPQPGEVAPIEAIQVNLADGHYLSVGIALQLTSTAKEVDGSEALDAVISVFSGLPVERVNQPKERAALKKELLEMLEERYPDEVMGVYFTQFVTQ